MTQRDRDRLVVLKKAQKYLVTQKQAAEELGISDRQVRRLIARISGSGDQVAIHGLRGRPSNRRLSDDVRAKAVAVLSQEVYRGFGPTLASEYLAKKHKLTIGREALRQLMMQAGLWRGQKQKSEAVHEWRERKHARGEMVQWDTSEHDWLEARGEKLYLIAMIDDAKRSTRRVGRPGASSAHADRARVFTDLPYNVDYTGKTRREMKIANDNLSDEFGPFLEAACWSILSVSAGPIYTCMSSSELHTLHSAFTETGGHWSTYIMWTKHLFTLGRSDYQRQYEPILYGSRQGTEHFWCGARDQGDVWWLDKPRIASDDEACRVSGKGDYALSRAHANRLPAAEHFAVNRK